MAIQLNYHTYHEESKANNIQSILSNDLETIMLLFQQIHEVVELACGRYTHMLFCKDL